MVAAFQASVDLLPVYLPVVERQLSLNPPVNGKKSIR